MVVKARFIVKRVMLSPAVFKRIKNFFIYWSARAAMTLVGLVPKRFVRPVGGLLGSIAHRFARAERRRARRQIADAMEIPLLSPRVDLLTRGVFYHLGWNAVEICRAMLMRNKVPVVLIPDASRRVLDDALESGAGVVFATGHVGNWEVMALTLAGLGYPISAVVKESYDRRFTRLIEKTRARFAVQSIFRGRPGSSVGMLRVLKRAGVLGLLIDQDTQVPSTFVPFFGRQASTPMGAGTIAARTGAQIVIGTMRRSPNGNHLLEMTSCPQGVSPSDTTALITAELERRIRRHPCQWVWFHKRWKTRPGSDDELGEERAA